MKKIKIAIPKGSLEKDTKHIFQRAGFMLDGYGTGERGYRPTLDDPTVEVKVLRPQEIPMLVAEGYYDLGISGLDWFLETRSNTDAEVIMDLGYGRVDIVMAVPQEWDEVKTLEDLLAMPRREIRISTEYLNLAEDLVVRTTGVEPSVITPWRNVRRRGYSNVSLLLSFGATEAKPPEDAEAIIDNSSTGSTLRENGLKVIATVLKGSTARLIANCGSLHDPDRAEWIQTFRDRLARAADAPGRQRRRSFSGHF
ncbi:MAG: ATP phosphoribosyltransferase [Deltaproteobacteria bacterium]|nr:ATP phosphoribosyltransferase [Deltaproteobacteria bacterium]